MTSACDNLHPFADGQLDATDRKTFEHHLAECDDCAQGLEEIAQLGALADQVRQDAVRELQGAAAADTLPSDLPRRQPWWRRHRWRWHRLGIPPRFKLIALVVAGAAAATSLVLVRVVRAPSPDRALVAELTNLPYRAIEARLAAAEFRGYRPRSGERGPEQGVVDSTTTLRQQGLAALESRGEYHLLGVVYLLGQQYGRAERAMAQASDGGDLWNDRAVLAYQQGRMKEALSWSDRALSLAPGHGAALWNRALALESLGRTNEAARAFEQCAARNELGWSAEASLRASVLRAKLAPGEVPGGPH